MRLMLTASIAIVAFTSALASNPGEPLDCSDWVFLEPGLSCSVVIDDCTQPDLTAFCETGMDGAFDNEGNLYESDLESTFSNCPTTYSVKNVELIRTDGTARHVVARLDFRCGLSQTVDEATIGSQGILFDDDSGRFIIHLTSKCTGPGCGYGEKKWVAAIEGFATTFEILQTYTPPSGPLSFRVPAHPEGLGQADHFDTFYGDVADLPDFSKATAMSCHYPAAPPSVGDYLTVNDTSPTPATGEAMYIVTAVDDGAQTRVGRQQMHGVKSGRDPSALPVCSVTDAPGQ